MDFERGQGMDFERDGSLKEMQNLWMNRGQRERVFESVTNTSQNNRNR